MEELSLLQYIGIGAVGGGSLLMFVLTTNMNRFTKKDEGKSDTEKRTMPFDYLVQRQQELTRIVQDSSIKPKDLDEQYRIASDLIENYNTMVSIFNESSGVGQVVPTQVAETEVRPGQRLDKVIRGLEAKIPVEGKISHAKVIKNSTKLYVALEYCP